MIMHAFIIFRKITSTKIVGNKLHLYSCKMISNILDQPSRIISPYIWVKLKSVLVASRALGLLPNSIVTFSGH